MGNPRVGIVLLNWNGWRDTVECLESLTHLSYDNHEIFVVDNNSQDESIEILRKVTYKFTLLINKVNSGFSGGNNMGIFHAQESGCTHFWLLNNDTTVSTDALSSLVEKFTADSSLGLLGSVIYEYDTPGKIQAWGGGSLRMPLAITRHYTEQSTDAEIDCVLGASMFTSRPVIDKIGLLDERLFFFMEDTDFSLRVLHNGYKLGVAEKSRVYHKGGSSLKSKDGHKNLKADVYYNTSLGYFMKKYNCGSTAALVRVLLMVGNRVRKAELMRIPVLVNAFIEGYRQKSQLS